MSLMPLTTMPDADEPRMMWAAVTCPQCKEQRDDQVRVGHAQSPDAWRVNGRLQVMCSRCLPPRTHHLSFQTTSPKRSNLTPGARSLAPKTKHSLFYSKGKVQRGFRGHRPGTGPGVL